MKREIPPFHSRYFYELKDEEVADVMEVNMASMTWMPLSFSFISS